MGDGMTKPSRILLIVLLTAIGFYFGLWLSLIPADFFFPNRYLKGTDMDG